MTGFVVDTSVAIKWVIPEENTPRALALLRYSLCAPDLLVAECANVFWKMARRSQLSAEEAQRGVVLLQGANLDLVPMRLLLPRAVAWACRLDHAAYDCFFIALAQARDEPLVTADRVLRDRVAGRGVAGKSVEVVLLSELA
jgi:predicted nucleic acid-binding protein